MQIAFCCYRYKIRTTESADKPCRIGNLKLPQVVKGQSDQAIPEGRLDESLAGHEDIGEIEAEGPVKDQKTPRVAQLQITEDAAGRDDHEGDHHDVGHDRGLHGA